MRLCTSLTEPQQIPDRDRDRMFRLMQACYENLNRQQFDCDLDRKWLVIQVRDPEIGELVGFSTQVVIRTKVEGESISALYSGDTVMSPSHWGDTALAHAWGQLALQLIDKTDTELLFWFLTSKGFRTYRYLPLFFREYSPKYGSTTSEKSRRVIDALGLLVAGEAYRGDQQVIGADSNKYFTRPLAVEPGLRATLDPHVRYFVEQNPGYARGDELCCLAPLSRGNFTRLAYRVINAKASRESVH